MAKRSAAELWTSLDEATMEAELEDALATPAEVRGRELAEAGLDVDRALEEAKARVRAVEWRAAQEKSRRARRVVASFSAAAALAASIAVVMGVMDKTESTENLGSPPSGPVMSPDETSAPPAASLRRAAAAACKARRWAMCKARLDEAARVDPEGDKDPAVREMRQRAEEGKKQNAP